MPWTCSCLSTLTTPKETVGICYRETNLLPVCVCTYLSYVVRCQMPVSSYQCSPLPLRPSFIHCSSSNHFFFGLPFFLFFGSTHITTIFGNLSFFEHAHTSMKSKSLAIQIGGCDDGPVPYLTKHGYNAKEPNISITFK